LFGVRTCLLPLLQADSQSGGVAPTVSTVGFPDSTVRESHDRVRAAIRNAGLKFPGARITVSLPTCGR
jgi:magnesium chelatase family protein